MEINHNQNECHHNLYNFDFILFFITKKKTILNLSYDKNTVIFKFNKATFNAFEKMIQKVFLNLITIIKFIKTCKEAPSQLANQINSVICFTHILFLNFL